jgi:hypothetical protein
LLNSPWRIKVLVLIAFIYKKYWDFNGMLLLLASGCVKIGNIMEPFKTIGFVDLTRYAGQWYEIARYPNKFQEGCVLAARPLTACLETLLPWLYISKVYLRVTL